MKLNESQLSELRSIIDTEIRKGISDFLSWGDKPGKPIEDPIIADFSDPITESTWDNVVFWILTNLHLPPL